MNESLSTTPAAKKLDLANLQDVVDFGKKLAEFVEKNGMVTKFKSGGKENKYVNVDGWKFAGMAFGLTCIPKRPVKRESQILHVMYFKVWNKWDKTWDNKPLYSTSNAEEVQRMKEADAAKPEDQRRYAYTKQIPELVYECEADVMRIMPDNSMLAINYGFAICSNSETAKVGFDEYAIASMAQTRAIAKAYRNVIGFVVQAAGFEPTPAEEITEEMVAKPEPKAPEALSEDVILSIESFDNETEDGWNKYLKYVWDNQTLHDHPEFMERCRAKRAQMKFNPDNRKS